MYPHRHIAMVTLMLAVFGSFHFSLGQDATPTTCQSLQSSICALQVNYTQTHFPNFVGHEHPNDAELQLQTFTPLIQFGCSEYLPQFLCAVFYPYCDSNGVKLPCQSVCHIVYDGCMPVLESFGFPWPSAMDCSLFPTQQGCFSVDTTTTKPIPAITSPEVPVIELSTVKPTQNTNVPSMVCEPLLSEKCLAYVNYNYTTYPNYFGNSDWRSADTTLRDMTFILQMQCSDYLPLFMCSVIHPKCADQSIVPPCQSLCQDVYDGCNSVFAQFDVEWPEYLDCSQFPSSEDSGDCVKISISEPEEPATPQCETVTLEMCGDFYNGTSLPNSVGHTRQSEVSEMMTQSFQAFASLGCSEYFSLLLCSMYLPKCDKNHGVMKPCQSLCQRVKDDCQAMLDSAGVPFPMDCEMTFLFSTESSPHCVSVDSISPSALPAPSDQCETVTLEMCGDFYNGTSLPNSIGHTTQSEVSEMMESFQIFASFGCSEYFLLLLCSMYLPKCDKSHGVMKPCQSLCQRVKDDCQAALDSAGVPFPMDCEMTFLFSTESSPHCVSVDSISPSALPAPGDQCETVTLEMCGDFYNGTSLPNSIGHTTQSEVSEMMESFQIFASFGCSEYFLLLLCSMYLPKCDKNHGVMKPCQSLCQRVKDDCQAMLDSAGVPFPMDCEMTFLFSTESPPHCVSVDYVTMTTEQAFSTTVKTVSITTDQTVPTTPEKTVSITTEQGLASTVHPGCPDPGTVENGLISTNSGALTFPAVPGSQLTFICKDGFSLVGTPVSVCKFDSSWSLPLPQCIADCSDPGTPAHGYQIGTPSYQAYTTVSFNCDHGYQLAGAHIITCNDGVWSHTLPVCTVFCEEIHSEYCQGLSYSLTGFPNFAGHSSQSQAEIYLQLYSSMLSSACDRNLRLLLCSAFLPPCERGNIQPPCQTFCQVTHDNCIDSFAVLELPWPVELNCSNLTDNADHCLPSPTGLPPLTSPISSISKSSVFIPLSSQGVQTSGVETTASSQSGDTQQPITDQNDKEQTSRRGYIRCTAERESDSYCLNGGTCFQLTVDGVQEQQCICHGNFTGKRCQERVLTDAERSRQEQADKKRNIAIGVGIGIACLVVLAIVIVLIIFCRKQMRHKTHYFSSRPDSAVFTNPAYDDVTLTRKDAESYPKDNEGFKEEDLLESKNKNLSAEPYREPSDKVIENKLSESDEIHPVPFCEPVEDEPASPGSDSSKVKGQSPTAIDNPSYQTFQYPYQDDTVIDKLKVDKF
ncbi:uncharacterized protein [Ptychodera flava]|uniref:uncharacterized protein isoform X2 n=1 Tax=Ptychodera flava TaxID=63121 RepID=UPI00396A8B9C